MDGEGGIIRIGTFGGGHLCMRRLSWRETKSVGERESEGPS